MLLLDGRLSYRADVIRSFIRISVLAFLATVVAACSSSESPRSEADAGLSGGGEGGKGAGGKATGGKSGGNSGSGGEGGGGMVCTTADAGSDNCRQCLAGACCDDLTACLKDDNCTKALADQEACFRTPGQEMSFCFGNFTRALQGDAGESAGVPPLGICIIQSCRAVCGGPGGV